jgi:hypothetical protein
VARESEARLQALLDRADRDLDERFVSVNRVAADRIGDTACVESKAGQRPIRDGIGAVTFELTAGHRDGSDHD